MLGMQRIRRPRRSWQPMTRTCSLQLPLSFEALRVHSRPEFTTPCLISRFSCYSRIPALPANQSNASHKETWCAIRALKCLWGPEKQDSRCEHETDQWEHTGHLLMPSFRNGVVILRGRAYRLFASMGRLVNSRCMKNNQGPGREQQ